MGDIVSNYQCRIQLTMRDTYMIVFGSDVQFNADYLDWMNTYTKNGKPYKWIVCCNQIPMRLEPYQEDTELGTINVCKVNDVVYENIYIVLDTTTLNIGEKVCFFIPGLKFDVDQVSDIARTCKDNNIYIDYIFSYMRPIVSQEVHGKREECLKYVHDIVPFSSWISEIQEN